MATPNAYPPPAALEEQVVEALLPVLPADWHFVAVQAELGDDPTHPAASFVSVCLFQIPDGAWHTQALPTLPPALLAGLVVLRAALSQYGLKPWQSTELRLQGDGSYEFTYSYEPPLRLRGLTAPDDAASRLEPAAFLARFLAAEEAAAAESAAGNSDNDDYEASGSGSYSGAPPAAPARAEAAPTVWVCTWCHQEYASARQPTSFQPDKCPRNPGKAHAWHQQ